jgi:hypothetical protein
MAPYGEDIYTEADSDPDTLANLGPLRPMAGVWESVVGDDVHPVGPGSDASPADVAAGTENQVYIERYELQPTDPQTNGPQLFYGLRYHVHIVKPGEVETFHDQVGYWLWEPAARAITHTIAIPRGQVALAGGSAEPDATTFEVKAEIGSGTFGILSNPFLDRAFRTLSFVIRVTANPDGTWSYYEDTVMQLPDRGEPFHHIDQNTLALVEPPTPNPLALAALPPAPATRPSGNTDGLAIGSLRQEKGNLL